MTITRSPEEIIQQMTPQEALETHDWGTASQAATWLADNCPAGPSNAERSAEASSVKEETSKESLTKHILAAVQAMGASQTHATPNGITINVNINVETNTPPF